MLHIIDEVLEAEKKADKTIQEARKLLNEHKKRIESENSQKISLAQKEGQKLVENSIANAKREAGESYAAAMKQIAENNEIFKKNIKNNRDTTIDAIIHLLITPEQMRI